MEITTTTTTQNPRRQAAVNALAIVGFIVLIIIGIVLAVYAVKFIPNAFDGSASAISSVFKSGDDQEPQLDVIDSTGAISFEPIATTTETDDSDEDKDVVIADDSKNTNTKSSGTKNTTTTTRTTTRTVQVPVTTPPPAPFGNPDLTARITATGYCTSDNPSSFRTSDTITGTKNGGVRFTIKNVGTNVARDWDFSYKVPSALSEQTVRNQHTLNPNDQIDYTLCFEKPKVGDNREIRIEADPGEDLRESNENNNVATAQVDIEKR